LPLPDKKMDLIPIKVECHSGFKADEYPKNFFWKGKNHIVFQVTDRWFQAEEKPEFPVADYFKVETTFGLECILKHEIKNDRWYLWSVRLKGTGNLIYN
jgi:hypothetical protein